MTRPDMRAQFEFTTADHEYVWTRLAARARTRSPSLRLQRRLGLIAVALAGGAIFFLAAGGPLAARVIAALAGGAIGAALWMYGDRRNTSKMIRMLVRERSPEGTSSPFSVDLTHGGMLVRAPEIDAVIAWDEIEEIEDHEGSIDFWTRDGNMVVVQDRAFASPDERAAFLDLAHALRDEAWGDRS
jgi:hypothetical protein